MASLLSSCLGRSKDTSSSFHNGHVPPTGHRPIDEVNPAKCLFCRVTSDRFNIVLEDDKYICFRDRSPAAQVHLLVIPRTHMANAQSLTQRDSVLVGEMQVLGNKALDIVAQQAHDTSSSKIAVAEEQPRFGFHIPPFRSVDHLHLHCLQLPFRSTLKALKYRVAEPSSADYCKGWSWFAEWSQTCALLDAGRKVEVKSC
ncbi:hypothetical protein NDA13_003973 [Ustilago tritici]|nr:hypothetical protein NDA13_003973 [Ustilago tritici]